MIPLQLQLKNFLSYGPELQTVDFSTYPLICLSGKNGHGKSALLDAVTWALWGQARKKSGTAKADDGLLRLGQTQMMVSLDFECNGQLYRVRREYARTYGKPYAALDFAIIDPNDESLISLTDKTIRKTQDKIERTLHLSFDSFSNSAFLRQGNANEFSQKSPKERKVILANILGLDEYEQIRKLAMEKSKLANAEKKQIVAFQEKREQELEKTTEITTHIKTLTEQLTTLGKQETEYHKQQVALEKKRSALTNEKKEQEILTFKVQQITEQEKKQRTSLLDTRATWRSVHKQQLHLPDHKRLETEKQALIAARDKHQADQQKHLELKEQALSKKELLQKLEQRLHAEHATVLNTKKVALERCIITKITLEKTIAELNKALEVNTAEQQTLTKNQNEIARTFDQSVTNEWHKTFENQFEKRKAFYQNMVATGNWTKQELTSLEQKQQLTHDTHNPSCPLCEQNLTASRRRFLHNTFAKKEGHLRHRLQRMSSIIKKLKQILLEQHKQLESLKKHKELGTAIAKLKTEHEQYTKIIAAHTKELYTLIEQEAAERKALEQLEKQQKSIIESDEQHKKITQELLAIITKGKALKYDHKAHELTQKQLQHIEQQLNDYNKLREQIALQEERKKTIIDLCAQLKQLKKEHAELHKNLEAYKHLSKSEEDLRKEEVGITQAIKDLYKQKEQLLQEKGSLENQQQKLKQLEKEHKEQQQTIKKLDATIDDYQTIATATSKDGIQALLIEDAIPEIEQEANNLLAKLTDNQAQIFIESLRDLKKGGTKETLDIKISDSIGIRPYEMFSGGEAFRIDFALRIAISKLLARRAGTALQTLIIDEGFGSQDEDGLGHIMDAIYKIQDDFLKVIVVSHLPAMKDQFPVHFFIEKKANGSTVTVLEQG